MNAFAKTDRAPRFDFNQPAAQGVEEAEYRGRETPSSEAFHQFEFDQTIVPLEGGRSYLRLKKPLLLQINESTLRFTVKDWGIEMDCPQLGELPRELARRFLRLFQAAGTESLTEAEQADLVRISDYVDFQEYSISRSAPRYLEGTLRSRGDRVIVEWQDGAREAIDWDVSRVLSEVNAGEKFSAFVKLGKDDKTLSIERVSLLKEPAGNEDWESWPKRS